jgi:hypothetical protein
VPEATQYMFSHRELLDALIKKAGVHEGKWQLAVGFSLAAVNAGPAPGQMVPSAVVGISNIGIIKAQPESPQELVADAAVVNPASSGTPQLS